MGAIKTSLTFEEFEQLPDQPGKRELLKGELIELPPAKYRHNNVGDRLQELMRAALHAAHARGESDEMGQAHREMGYQLGHNSYVQPDVSVTHAGQTVTPNDYLWGAPAIAIEIISPANTAEDIAFKIELYFEFGAREVWVFYPKTRRVMVYVPGQVRQLGGNETLATPLLPGLQLSVREILGQ